VASIIFNNGRMVLGLGEHNKQSFIPVEVHIQSFREGFVGMLVTAEQER